MSQKINLTLHEWEIVFGLIDKELDRTSDGSRIAELEKLRSKIEESITV